MVTKLESSQGLGCGSGKVQEEGLEGQNIDGIDRMVPESVGNRVGEFNKVGT